MLDGRVDGPAMISASRRPPGGRPSTAVVSSRGQRSSSLSARTVRRPGNEAPLAGAFTGHLRLQVESKGGGLALGEANLDLSTNDDSKVRLMQACRELEAVLWRQMLRAAQHTALKTPLTDTGMAGQIYNDLFYDELAGKLAQHSDRGVAVMLYEQLSKAL